MLLCAAEERERRVVLVVERHRDLVGARVRLRVRVRARVRVRVKGEGEGLGLRVGVRLDLHGLAAARQRRRDAHEALVAEVGARHLGVLAEAAEVLVRSVQSRRE